MGCDIHGFLEYGYVAEGEQEPRRWRCLMRDIGDRNYEFFSLISECGRGSHHPVFPPRGLPPGELSYEVGTYMNLIVTDDAELAESEGFCLRSQAEGWGIIERDGSQERVAHPDLHSHTWLTRAEFMQVIAAYMFDVDATDYGAYPVQWDAAAAAMQALEERGYATRLIFAFDN